MSKVIRVGLGDWWNLPIQPAGARLPRPTGNIARKPETAELIQVLAQPTALAWRGLGPQAPEWRAAR
jgi:hypothetical protein